GRGPWGFSATPGATEQWWPETRRRHGGGTAAARRFPRSPAAAPGRALSCRPARPPGARPRTAAGRKRPAGREGAATPLHSPPRHARMRHPGGREPMRSYRNSDTPPPIMEGAPPPADMRVPFIDWDRPPWNRWAFQRVRQILPTAPIRRGARVSPLPAAEGSLDGFAYRRGDGTSTTFAEMLDTTYTDGMWVWKDGRVLHESYHNGMDARTLHLLQSVSKSITATAGATLIADGLLDPAAPVTEYLPELARTAWAGATVRQVLDMTTGVRFTETYDQRDSDIG